MANNFVVNDKHGMVLHITLNRPDKFNSFNREMAMQLLAAFHQAAITPSIRAVLLTEQVRRFAQDKIWPKLWTQVVRGLSVL